MNWPTWNEAAIAALIAIVLSLGLRWLWPRSRFTAAIAPAAQEFALVAALYSIWRIARQLPLDRPAGAIARARWIAAFEQDVFMPTELSLQHFVLRHDWLARLTNTYYATLHVPVLIGFLIWLYVRHRDKYPHWRNGLVIVTACCLVVRFMRVAPPRFLPDLGYIDLSTRYGLNLYGPVGTGVSDQYAAMPSIHVAWAAVVSFGIVAASTSRFRWLALLYVTGTFLAVSATGNHWWLDGIVAIAFLAAGLAIDTQVRRAAARRRAARAPAADPEAEVGEPVDAAADQ